MSDLSPKKMARPTKVLEFGPNKKIKIHLKGVDTPQEHYIDVIKYRYYDSQADRDKAGIEHIRRLICCLVKKVEGVKLRGEPWDVEFTDETKEEITLESYVVLDKVMNKLAAEQVSTLIMEFYHDQKKEQLDGIELDLDSPEDVKKKD